MSHICIANHKLKDFILTRKQEIEISVNHEQIQTSPTGTYTTVHSQSFTSIHSLFTHLRAIAEKIKLDSEKPFPLQINVWHLKTAFGILKKDQAHTLCFQKPI